MNPLGSKAAQAPTAEPAHAVQAQFESPPKKRSLHRLLTERKEALVKDHLARPLKKRRFMQPLFFINEKIELDKVPESLKTSVQAIENYSLNLGHIVTSEARELMTGILENEKFSLEDKEIELGVLFFYLTAQKPLPKEPPLLDARLEEIEGEVLLLREEHKSACPDNKVLPSGAHHYMQRAFVHMIFTEDGSFNLGGCLAVKRLLTASRLCLLITEDQRAQFLNITSLLLEDEDFRNLFFQPITLHPTLKKVITLDLKKSSKDSVSPAEIRWALLMQFFSLPGQINDKNCYAISSYLNLLSEHPKILLKMTIDLLQTGKLSFEGVEIPVLLILGNRLRWEKDYAQKLTQQTALTLTPLMVAQNALGIKTFPKANNQEERALADIIHDAFDKSSEEAKQLFTAQKFNMLQQMMLSVIQFIAKNRTTHSQDFETTKQQMLLNCHDNYMPLLFNQFENAGIGDEEEVQNLLDRFECEILKKIFTVDMVNWSRVKRGERVIYENHSVGFKIKGPSPALRLMSRLYGYKEGNFVPIERITDFGNFFAECVDEALGTTPSRIAIQSAALLKTFFTSSEFHLATATWLAKRNKKMGNPLSERDYLESDALFLNASGGKAYLITDYGPFFEAFSPRIRFTSSTTEEFFRNLCAQMRKIAEANPRYQTDSYHHVLMRFEGHAFNLTPHTFGDYWRSDEDLLGERVYRRSLTLLKSTLSTKQKRRILTDFEGTKGKTIYAAYLTKAMSASEFKEALLSEIPKEDHSDFKTAFNKGLQEISYRDFKSKAPDLIEGIIEHPLAKEDRAQLARYFSQKNKNGAYLSPYQAAKLLKKAILTLENSMNISSFQLEQKIRELYSMPEIIQIANLNWLGRKSENLKYQTFVVHADLADEELVFSKRVCGAEQSHPSLYKLLKRTDLFCSSHPASSKENN